MKLKAVVVLVGIGLLLAMRPLVAHHAFSAEFDINKPVKLTGAVTKFDWTNPHIYIEMDVTAADGEVRHWLIECANTTILNRVGWKWNMIKAGDEIAVVVSPLRNGEPAALLKRVRLPDGTEFGNGGPAGPATIGFDGQPVVREPQ